MFATTTPRVRATGWRAVPANPQPMAAPAGRLLPGLLRQVYRGTTFEKLVYAGPDPQVKIQRIGTVIHSRKVEGLPVAPELAADGPEAGLPAVGPFTVRWAGWLEVKAPGTHGLAVNSDDGAVLRVGGVPVVSDWGPHAINRRETRVELAAGWYAVEVEYMQDSGDSVLDLEWRPPGAAWQALDGKVLRHAPAVAGQVVLDAPPPPRPDDEEPGYGADVV